MMNRKILLTIAVAAMMLPIFVSLSSGEAEGASNGHKVLFDMGNGTTVWANVSVESGDNTIDKVLQRTAANTDGITYVSSGSSITVNGIVQTVIGGPDTGGTLSVSGTTGRTVTSEWHVFRWDGTGHAWVPAAASDAYSSSAPFDIAVAFYPSGIVPAETPEHQNAWTMIRGNAEQTGEQTYIPVSADDVSVAWAETRYGQSGVHASVLTAQGFIFAKFSSGALGSYAGPAVRCYDKEGNMIWEFRYQGIASYETTTPLIAGDSIFIQGAMGRIFKFNWKTAAGTFDENNAIVKKITVPQVIAGAPLEGMSYAAGPGSFVMDSGCIYMACTSGMVYCMDTELELIWSRQMGGRSYYMSPTVFDGYLTIGALNGRLYVMDKKNGMIIDEKVVYTEPYSASTPGIIRGSVASPVVIRKSDGKYRLLFSVSSGRGMDSLAGGIGIYEFDGTGLTRIYLTVDMTTFGLVTNYVQRVVNSEFQGIYFGTQTKGLFRMDIDGNYELMNSTMYSSKAPPVLVNGDSIFLVSYEPRKPIYQVALDGTILTSYTPEISSAMVNYSMSPVVIVDGMVFTGNDSSLIAMSGAFFAYIPPETPEPPWTSSPTSVASVIIIVIVLIIVSIYVIMRLMGIKRPFSYINSKFSHYVGGDDLRHNAKNRHRLLVMTAAGAVITFAVFIICLCNGPTSSMSLENMFSSLFSAISKGGSGLNYDELMVYESRLPRTLMALLIGIGLSIAGCMYQAIIRNPLVDPYIMGVSAGAGTAAVAVIGFNFTLFGLFPMHSIYLTALCAMVGGTAAFFATMLIAEKAGGTSLNYVLAGIVIGLALSSIQTLMLSMAGHTVSNALGWLFGSFSNVSWDHVSIIFFPVLALSFVPLLWAKEFNLVLLGEDQAKQMGLNVRRFSRLMLIMASVLTALCVAFVGIIGFVGLVIPHLCRMILGGDHRLVLPASIATGGALMMLADLISRTVYMGHELPVGAITTMIGVPVFAYLLIRRGKLYEG